MTNLQPLTLLCSAKFQAELGIKLKENFTPSESELPLSVWCADVQRIGHQKIVFLMERNSLYPVIVGPVKRADFSDVLSFFWNAIGSVWRAEGVEEEMLSLVSSSLSGVRLLKNTDGSLRGYLNDHVRHGKWTIGRAGGVENTRFVELSRNLARKPNLGRAEFAFPVETLQQILTGSFGFLGALYRKENGRDPRFLDSWADEMLKPIGWSETRFASEVEVCFSREEFDLLSRGGLIFSPARTTEKGIGIRVDYADLETLFYCARRLSEETEGRMKKDASALSRKIESLLCAWSSRAEFNERYESEDLGLH